MNKDQVVYIRDTIKGEDNLPVRVAIDGNVTNIDEANAGQLVHWDDDNEVLMVWRLADPQTDIYPNNAGRYISMSVVSYDDIKAIEMSILPLSMIEDRMNAFGVDATCAANATKAFGQLLRMDLPDFESADYNRIMGVLFKVNRDEYYSNRFTENFKETRMTAANNKYVDELRAAAAAEAESEDASDSEDGE